MYPRVVIAGTHSGVGKTTVSLGLMGVLSRRGLGVQPFKAGPDFIDPTHHQAVTGRPSRNLDTWLMSEEIVGELFERAAGGADLSIIEGVMGLFDGASGLDERGSAAHLAKILQAPVLLVMDVRALARSAAAVALGFQKLDPALHLAGIVLNRVSTTKHEEYLREAIGGLTGLPVLGALREMDEIEVPSRHLGLYAGWENPKVERAHEEIIELAQRALDLDAIVQIARSAPVLPKNRSFCFDQAAVARRGPIIAYALDEAFYFYYQDNLDLLTHLGCRLVPFSPLRDPAPPPADLLYLGGGYPELHARELAANESMRAAVRRFAESGGHVYAECGGLMYLCESLMLGEGAVLPMCGVLPAQTVMTGRRLRLGYTLVRVERDCLLGPSGLVSRGHEFHYSTLKVHKDIPTALTISRAGNGAEKPDGLLVGNTLASYTHIHFASNPVMGRHLVETVWPGLALRAGGLQSSFT